MAKLDTAFCNKCGQTYDPSKRHTCPTREGKVSIPALDPPKEPDNLTPVKESFSEQQRRHAKAWRDKNREKYNEYMREYRRKRREDG